MTKIFSCGHAKDHLMNNHVEISSLTGSRFIASLVVLISHAYFFTYGNSNSTCLDTISILGGIGVLYFFVLSGYIISYNYLNSGLESRFKALKYLMYRVVRIYPLYFLILMVYLAFYLYNSHGEIKKIDLFNFIANISMIQSYLPISGLSGSWNSPGWSISTEFFFYISFLYIFKIKKCLTIALMVIVLNAVWAIIYHFVITSNLKIWSFYVNPFYRVTDFIIGVLIYKLVYKIKYKLDNYYVNLAIQVLCVLSLYGLYYLANINEKLALNSPFVFHNLGLLLISLLLVSQIFTAKKSLILSSGFMRFLGNASFCLYLIHYGILQAFVIKNNFFRLFSLIVFCIVISCIIYALVENPLHKKLKYYVSNYRIVI